MQTLVLNINAEKTKADAALAFFQEIFNGTRSDASPNEIPYLFVPTYRKIFTENDIPRIIHDNEKHTPSFGVILITGLNKLDTNIRLKNNFTTSIRTILNSLPPPKGSQYHSLFQQSEHQPNTDWIVCVFPVDVKEKIHPCLHKIEQNIKRITHPEDVGKTILNTLKNSGPKLPNRNKGSHRFTLHSADSVSYTREMVAQLPNPTPQNVL
jgi:hypothetical protein